jgi:hypothetical protein
MPRLRSLLAAFACALPLSAGCGGGAAGGGGAAAGPYLDPAYRFDPMVPVTLAIAPPPLQGDLGQRADTSLELVFNDTPGLLLTGHPSTVRQRMQGDRGLVDILNRAQSPQLDPMAGQPPPSLTAVLSPRELLDLRQKASNSDLLLVPDDFELRDAGARTHGRARYRVFDLRSGALVMQGVVEAESPHGGESGRREAMGEVVIRLQQAFAKHLLHNARDAAGSDGR